MQEFLRGPGDFGAWFGSCLTRLKEFFIFGTLGYLAFKGFGLSVWGETFRLDAGNEFYILPGFPVILIIQIGSFFMQYRAIQ